MSRCWGSWGCIAKYWAMRRASFHGPQTLPDCRHARRNFRYITQVRDIFTRRMEVRSGRQGESEVPRQTYLCRGLEAAVAADFDRVAAALSKVPEQGLQDAGRKSIAIGMRKYRLAAGAMDPVNYQGQLRPGGWYVTGTTGTEVTTERVAGVAHVLLFHQEAGEMAATDRRTISGMAPGTRQAAGYAHAIEPGRDENRTFATRAPDVSQSVHKFRRLRVDV